MDDDEEDWLLLATDPKHEKLFDLFFNRFESRGKYVILHTHKGYNRGRRESNHQGKFCSVE